MKTHTITSLALTAALATAYLSAPAAQSAPALRFDVASVKVNRSGEPMRMGPALQPGGRVFAANQPLRVLIRVAYGLEDNQVSGGPSWIESAFFDVEARAGAYATPEEARAMLRTLLAERFGLAVHTETREFPISELTLDPRSGKGGPQLKPSGKACAPPQMPAGVPLPPPPPPGPSTVPIATTALRLTCPSIAFPGHISLRFITIDVLGQWLANTLRQPVVNRTGLAGMFDADMTYAAEPGAPFATGGGVASASTLPSLPAALQEQLGLRLQSTRGPVQVLVIDRANPPTDN